MPAPVALFVYNRLWHTRETVEALKANLQADNTTLYIFSDGPKTEADAPKVQDVRDYIKTVTGFSHVELKETKVNQGLANAIISGVSEVLKNHETIIVLEDDMVTSPFFLTYMNDGLQLYRDEPTVVSIHGYVWPVQNLPETFFLKGADCWGWATWQRGWKWFDPDGQHLLNELNRKNLSYEFDYYGAYPYTEMLKKQISGKNNSWAIRWYASAFLHDKITLYPGKSFVKNIGNDTSGTHSWDNDRFDHASLADSIQLNRIDIKESHQAKKAISEYYKASAPSWLKKVYYRVKLMLKNG